MKTATYLSLAFVLVAGLSFGQTVTPNTTLCAAATASARSVCLTAITGVQNQTGLYIDDEYMVVNLSNSQTVSAGGYVPVLRGARAGASIPAAHANGATVWLALTPSSSLVTGINGFLPGTQLGDVGTCVRTNEVYLPHIWPNRNMKRDCNIAGTATSSGGVWVDFAPALGVDMPSPSPLVSIVDNQALSVSSGNYVLNTKAGVIALTLTAPTAGVDDGMVISITANNGAYADTLVATSLLETGGGSSPYTTATFGATTAYNGATLVLKAYNGKWYVVSSVGVAFS